MRSLIIIVTFMEHFTVRLSINVTVISLDESFDYLYNSLKPIFMWFHYVHTYVERPTLPFTFSVLFENCTWFEANTSKERKEDEFALGVEFFKKVTCVKNIYFAFLISTLAP